MFTFSLTLKLVLRSGAESYEMRRVCGKACLLDGLTLASKSTLFALEGGGGQGQYTAICGNFVANTNLHS